MAKGWVWHVCGATVQGVCETLSLKGSGSPLADVAVPGCRKDARLVRVP